MSRGSYFAAGGELHARTMLAWHRDAQTGGKYFIVGGSFIALAEGFLYLTRESVPYLLCGLLGLVLVIAGMIVHHHHGTKAARWQGVLNLIEAQRRDRVILHHVGPRKDWR